MRDDRLHAYTRTHHGLITRDVALRLGMSPSGWRRALASGRLERLSTRVARVPGAPETRVQRLLAAVWGAGPGARASHRSCAWLWGVERPHDDPLEVITDRGAHPDLPGVVIHRPTDRLDLGGAIRHGVPLTSPLRMLVDLGAVDPAGVYPAMETLLIARTVPPAAVIGVLNRHAERGRAGVSALRAAVADYPFALAVSDSMLEGLMARLLADHDLPAVEFQPRIGAYRPDFRIVGTRILLECEGRSGHQLGYERFEYDRFRLAALAADGWIVIPFTWRQITGHPAAVARRIRQALHTWAPGHLVA